MIQHQHLNRCRTRRGRSLQGAQLVARRSSSTTIETNQGQDLPAILRHPLAARHFHLRHRELLEARQRAERYGHAGIARTREQQEGLFLLAVAAASVVFSVRARSRVSVTTLARCARPSTSRISATLPSPMMLDPAKVFTVLSCLRSGFTTISSVSLIWSTTKPNCRSSACSTTMLTLGCREPSFPVPSAGR